MYWQVELIERVRAMSAFVTMDDLYQYICPFGVKNTRHSFQRLVNKALKGGNGVSVYRNYILVYTEEWEENVQLLEEVF